MLGKRKQQIDDTIVQTLQQHDDQKADVDDLSSIPKETKTKRDVLYVQPIVRKRTEQE